MLYTLNLHYMSVTTQLKKQMMFWKAPEEFDTFFISFTGNIFFI